MEIPRCFSISIQSDLACWLEPRPLLYRRSEWPVEQQHLLGDGSLTGIRVRNNGKSAALRHLLQIRRQRHNSFFLSKRHRAALVETKIAAILPINGGGNQCLHRSCSSSCNEETVGGRDAFWLLAIVRIQPAGRKPGVDATENIGLGSVANHQHA